MRPTNDASVPRGADPRGADPRLFQVAFLLAFLAWVQAFREFTLAGTSLLVLLVTAIGTQAAFVRALRLRDPGFLSPLISALSLGLLLRANDPAVAALAAFLAIASKFALRFRGKHLFNPTNFGILATVLVTGRAWVSPAQWGSEAFAAFFFAALGLAVVRKVGRLDITLAFLGAHATLQLGRVLWLGHGPAVFLHRVSSGALILFAFFMISDPRSTPNARGGRIAFACLVALVAHFIQFRLFIPSAPLWALLIVSPLTPLLDVLWRGSRFEWARKGVPDVPSSAVLADAHRAPGR